jgi:enamine deaminase RidA (YjgF/YER057c/UK114 family)
MPVGNNATAIKPGSRLRELGLVLPKPPSPLGAYVESSQAGSLLFVSGTLPLVDGKLAISGKGDQGSNPGSTGIPCAAARRDITIRAIKVNEL